MNVERKKMLFWWLLPLLIILIPTSASAEKTNVGQNVGFTVQAIRPETQVDTNLSFFYPAVLPNEEQTLELKIVNTSDEKLTLDLSVVNAATSINGNIDYSQANAQLDESLKTPLTDLVTIKESSISLNKAETKLVTLKVKTAAATFSGVKLGAVRVLKQVDKAKKTKGITTNYGYTIGIMLTEDKKPYNIGGDLVYKKAAAKIVNGYKTAAVAFQNPKPYVIQNLKMSAKLYKKGSSKAIGEKALENMSIAPNTSFDFPIQLGLGNLEPGTYRVTVNAENDQDSWDWEKEFKVSEQQAAAVNKNSAYKLTLPKGYYYSLIALAVLTVAVGALLLFFSLQTKKAKERKR